MFSLLKNEKQPIVLTSKVLDILIHIDVLMLCRKFEPIPTSIFHAMAIFKNEAKSEKITVLYIAHGFFQKMAPKSP